MHAKLTPSGQQASAIGDRVRHARKAMRLRQDELAAAAGVSTRAIHQIENGKPTSRLDTVGKVLAALGLELTVSERPVRRVIRGADDE